MGIIGPLSDAAALRRISGAAAGPSGRPACAGVFLPLTRTTSTARRLPRHAHTRIYSANDSNSAYSGDQEGPQEQQGASGSGNDSTQHHSGVPRGQPRRSDPADIQQPGFPLFQLPPLQFIDVKHLNQASRLQVLGCTKLQFLWRLLVLAFASYF